MANAVLDAAAQRSAQQASSANPEVRRVPGRPFPGEFALIREVFAPLAAGEKGRVRSPRRRGADRARAWLPAGGQRRHAGRGCPFPRRRSRIPGRAEASARQPVGPRRDGRAAARLPARPRHPGSRSISTGCATSRAGSRRTRSGSPSRWRVATPPRRPALPVSRLPRSARSNPAGRCCARTRPPGEHVYVSGTIGDAALGLRLLQGADMGLARHARDAAIARYRLPEPRLRLGMAVPASAAVDVSDGLIADLGHICLASGLGARIEAGRVPVSGRGAVGARPGRGRDRRSADRRRRLRAGLHRAGGSRQRRPRSRGACPRPRHPDRHHDRRGGGVGARPRRARGWRSASPATRISSACPFCG